MILENFLSLPPYVQYQGIEFVPQIIYDGGAEARLVYSISSVADDSPHKKEIEEHGCWANNLVDLENPPHQGFLKLYEGLYDDTDIQAAIEDCRQWLESKGFYGNHSGERTSINLSNTNRLVDYLWLILTNKPLNPRAKVAFVHEVTSVINSAKEHPSMDIKTAIMGFFSFKEQFLKDEREQYHNEIRRVSGDFTYNKSSDEAIFEAWLKSLNPNP